MLPLPEVDRAGAAISHHRAIWERKRNGDAPLPFGRNVGAAAEGLPQNPHA